MKKYFAFYIPYILFVLTLIYLILMNEKADLHLWLTSFNTPTRDVFFKYYSEVGGSIPFIIAGLALFYRYRIALFILVSQLAAGLVSRILKETWNESRPIHYFKEKFPDINLHQVAGVKLHSFHSFPSGHTISAYALFVTLSYFTKNKMLQLLYFVLALLVGFSRIYLSQHFALDVLVGSLIGVLVTLLCLLYLNKFPMKWANGSLRDVFSGK
ncbi:MAG: phosphatase PAP2 family protein [Paludibacter sp.]|nr:phosphatase PAP2 family protein [Paludibacter sp.]